MIESCANCWLRGSRRSGKRAKQWGWETRAVLRTSWRYQGGQARRWLSNRTRWRRQTWWYGSECCSNFTFRQDRRGRWERWSRNWAFCRSHSKTRRCWNSWRNGRWITAGKTSNISGAFASAFAYNGCCFRGCYANKLDTKENLGNIVGVGDWGEANLRFIRIVAKTLSTLVEIDLDFTVAVTQAIVLPSEYWKDGAR